MMITKVAFVFIAFAIAFPEVTSPTQNVTQKWDWASKSKEKGKQNLGDAIFIDDEGSGQGHVDQEGSGIGLDDDEDTELEGSGVGSFDHPEHEDTKGQQPWGKPSPYDPSIHGNDNHFDFEPESPAGKKDDDSINYIPDVQPPIETPQNPPHDNNQLGNDVHIMGRGERQVSFFAQPGILAAIIGGAVVGLLCTTLLVMFIVYRMRKMDEGSYPLDEPRKSPPTIKPSPEFYA